MPTTGPQCIMGNLLMHCKLVLKLILPSTLECNIFPCTTVMTHCIWSVALYGLGSLIPTLVFVACSTCTTILQVKHWGEEAW